MTRAVAIVGVGETKCGRREDVSYPELIREAVTAALEDAGISFKDIDAVVSGSMPTPMEGINAMHLYWSDAMAAWGKPSMRIATCGSTGISIAHTGFYHVASGVFDVVLAVGAEKMFEGDSQGTMTTVGDPWFISPFVGGAPPTFALQSYQYVQVHNLSEERVREATARISVEHHQSALRNPYAHIRRAITIDDVLKSEIICYPIRLYDVCPNSDGACAVIFASEDKVNKFRPKPAWVKAVSYCSEEYLLGDSDKVIWQMAINAAQEAYKMAGIQNPRKELDVVELYNPFTYQELIWYEGFGFCDMGEACQLVEDGVVFRGGELPVNPSGGVLCTNPIGASGLFRAAEAALQVTGRAGERQIPGAKLAFANAMGGTSNVVGIMILSSEL